MKPAVYLRAILLSALLNQTTQAAIQSYDVLNIDGDDAFIENTGTNGSEPGYEHRINSIETGTRGGYLVMWYTGNNAADRSDCYIESISGAGNLALCGSSAMTLNTYHLSSTSLAHYSGNLCVFNYSSNWDMSQLYDTATVLELDSTQMSGSIMLDVAGYSSEDPHFISALGITGTCSIGGLDAPDYSRTAAYLYSGSLEPGTTQLHHSAEFASYLNLESSTLCIDTSTDHHYHGTILGNLTIIKKGTGSQAFTGSIDSNCSFDLQGGKLALNNDCTLNTLTIQSGEMTCAGNLTTSTLNISGGILTLNGTLTTGTATFSGSSQLSAGGVESSNWRFILSSEHQETPLLTLSGNHQGAPDSITIQYDKSALARGWYQLVSYTGSFQTDCLLMNQSPALTEIRNNTLLVYIADGERVLTRNESAQLYWQGNSGTWETNQGHLTGNWSGPDSNSNFQPGDSVHFEQETTVNLIGTLEPAQVIVSPENGCVSFTGNGSISGAASVMKTGNGELSIAVANSYTGGTTIHQGTLSTLHRQALGDGGVTLYGGCLDMNNLGLSNTITIMGNAGLQNAGKYAGQLILRQGKLTGSPVQLTRTAALYEGEIAASMFGNAGVEIHGNTTLSAANQYSGNTTIISGTLSITHPQALSTSTVSMQGGHLNLNHQSLNNDIHLQGQATISNASNYSGTISLSSGILCIGEAGNAHFSSTGNSGIITGAGSVLHLNQSIQNTGELTLEGCFDISSLAKHLNACMIDAYGKENNQNGFIQDAGSYAQIITGGKLQAKDATILLHGQSVTPDSQGYASLPGTIHLNTYCITGDHSVSVSGILSRAGDKLQRISMNSGTLLVDQTTDCLEASGGVVQVMNAHLGGELKGTTRLEIMGNAVLHSANSHTGGTCITSGSLRLAHAQALGHGPVYLGSLPRSQAPTLDLADLPAASHLHLQGQSNIRGTENFCGSITMQSGAETTITRGSVLHLRPGQSLTLSPGGNTIHGQVNLDGGTIVLTGGALTLNGVVNFSSKTTLDLRQWNNLKEGTTFLVLNAPGTYDAGLITLLLPESGSGLALQFNPETGQLQLTTAAPSAALHLLPANERQIYQALQNIRNASGKLAEIIHTINQTTSTPELIRLLNQVGGSCYTSLTPNMLSNALTHAQELRQSAGSGFLLAPGSNTMVGIHGFYQQHTQKSDTRGPGYETHDWGSRLQVEHKLTTHCTGGLSLAYGQATITPDDNPAHTDTRTHLDLYAQYHGRRNQFLLAAGWAAHEFELTREGFGGEAVRVHNASGHSFTLSAAWDCQVLPHQLPGLFTTCALSSTLCRLDAFRESGSDTALHTAAQSAILTELSLGLLYTTQLRDNIHLSVNTALLARTGDTAEPLKLHFAQAPGESFHLSPAEMKTLDFQIGASLLFPISPEANLQTSVQLQQQRFSAQAAILLPF